VIPISRRRFVALSTTLTLVSSQLFPRVAFAQSDEAGGGGGDDWGGDDQGGGEDWGDGGFGGDWGSDGGDYGSSFSDAPSLDSLEMDIEQKLATGSYDDSSDDYDSAGSSIQEGAANTDFTANAIASIQADTSEGVTDTFKDAFDYLLNALYACFEATTEGLGGTIGYCATLGGDVYSTVGGGISASPYGFQIGYAPNGDAAGFLNGPAYSAVTPYGGLGLNADFAPQTFAVGLPSAGYSEGTYVGNMWRSMADTINDALNDFTEAGGRALQGIENQIRGMSEDPFTQQLH
jgi:hypothetical protein